MGRRLAVQEHLIDGASLGHKFEAAQRAGFDGIELRGSGEELTARLPELQAARESGVVMPSVTVITQDFIGDVDATARARARRCLTQLLDAIVEAGGTGVVTPAAFGRFSNHLPPFVPPRSPEQDREVLLEELQAVGEHAASAGGQIWLEPLNRYEDHMINTLAQAASLAKEINMDSVRITADTFHMNIEEVDLAASLRDVQPWLGHVQLGDSNRLEPGAGHLNWPTLTTALDEIEYEGWLAMECGLSGPPAQVLAPVAQLLKSKPV